MLIELTELKAGDTVRFKDFAGSASSGKIGLVFKVERNSFRYGWPDVHVFVDGELRHVPSGYLELLGGKGYA
jgi:hypothetical protein